MVLAYYSGIFFLLCCSSKVRVRLVSRTESLKKVSFPSVVVCNNSPLTKSFMFYVTQGSQFENNVSRHELFYLTGEGVYTPIHFQPHP